MPSSSAPFEMRTGMTVGCQEDTLLRNVWRPIQRIGLASPEIVSTRSPRCRSSIATSPDGVAIRVPRRRHFAPPSPPPEFPPPEWPPPPPPPPSWPPPPPPPCP